MTLDDDLAILRQAALFKSLDEEHLRHLAFGAERTNLREGAKLYQEGQRADCAFVVARGSFIVTQNDIQTGPFGEGVLLGEVALIAPMEWRNTAIAQSQSEVLRISRTLFRRILEAYPQLAAELHGHMAQRLQKLIKDVAPLARKFD